MASNPKPQWNVLREPNYTEYELRPNGALVLGIYRDSWEGGNYISYGLVTKHFYLNLIGED